MTTTTKLNGCSGIQSWNRKNTKSRNTMPPIALPSGVECRQGGQEQTDFDGISMPEGWLENLPRQAAQPPSESEAYQRAIAACLAEHEARQKRAPSRYALSPANIELDWRMVWLIIWLALLASVCLAAV